MSRVDQDPALQFDALRNAGIDQEHIVTDHASGAKADRPGLTWLLAQLQPGDVVTVWKLDRLGRSVSHLVDVVDELGRRDVDFRCLTESLDTTTAGGRLLFHVMAAVAQFERELIVERTKAGLLAARERNRPMGRPSKITAAQAALVKRLADEGMSHRQIAAATGLSRPAVGRIIRDEIASLHPSAPHTVTNTQEES